ncbi:MAG: hypothetical protein IH860_03160 [Chloroflexi bacterium]|nr:hypothetical protein [Chloroflexota bacterium]
MADSREVAEAVVLLLYESESFVTGRAMPVDGGRARSAR